MLQVNGAGLADQDRVADYHLAQRPDGGELVYRELRGEEIG